MLKKIYKITKTSWQQFNADECWTKAAALTYTTLLSIVPLFAVIFSIFTAFPIAKTLGTKMQNIIFPHLITSSAETVRDQLLTFINQADQLSILGLFFLLVTSIILIVSMEQVFNSIWHIKQNRKGISAVFLYLITIIIIPIIMVILLWVIIQASTLLPMLTSTINLAKKSNLFMLCIPYILGFLVLLLLYVALPNRKVPFKSAAIAATVAIILFEIIRRGFILYFSYVTTYEIIYGALAALPIFLIWLYISWLVILYGVVLNAVMQAKGVKSGQKT